MLIAAGGLRQLGVSDPLVAFGEEPRAEGTWAGRRFLTLQGVPAFELSSWCGTCPLVFRRLDGANRTLSRAAVERVLAEGLVDIDESVLSAFGGVLPAGGYVALLLEVQPHLVVPAGPGDYFCVEQVATWGVDAFWGLPEYPRTPYYRSFATAVDARAHLYEFVVPMVPPTWNDPAKVAAYAQRLSRSSAPTAVAVSTLDVCAPADGVQSSDWYWHWGLTHFLLDGHHKMQAAAATGRPLRLLSLLCVEGSLASAQQVARVPELRSRSPVDRAPA